MLDFGWLGQLTPDPRVTALQAQLNTLLANAGIPPIPGSGVVDTPTCGALQAATAAASTLPWITRVSSTMTTKIIQDPAVFAAALGACAQQAGRPEWPPFPTAPPLGFPHTYQTQSGDTLGSIATKFGRSFWEVLRTTNPFLGSTGKDAPIPANVLWLPFNWPSVPGGLAPSAMQLPIEKRLTGSVPEPEKKLTSTTPTEEQQQEQPPPPPAEKKGIGTGAVVALTLVGGAIVYFLVT